MNDYLKTGLDNCVPYELREYIYSKYGEQALADSDIGIDKAIESYLYWNKEGIRSDELLQKNTSGDYSIEELEQFLQLYVNTALSLTVRNCLEVIT